MTTSMPIRWVALFVAPGILLPLLSRPAEAGGYWFHHGHGQAVYVLQPSSVQAVGLVPAQATTHHLQLVPATQLQMGTLSGLQMAPASSGLATSGLTLSAGAPAIYYMAQPGGGLAVAPPTAAGFRGLTTGPGGVTDQDYQILATGLGGSFINVQNFETFLGNQFDRLFNQNSNLSQDQITTLLLDAARGFLTSQGFGFLLDPNVDAIIKRVIGKVIQNRQASQGGGGNGGNGGTNGPKVPAGGFTFTVTGQITLSPTGGGSTRPPGGNPNNGMPDQLTPDQPNLSPPAPPSR